MEVDRKAFRTLTSGLYVISAVSEDGRPCGCVVNTLLQVASEPPQLLVSLNKENATTSAVAAGERFCASVLSQDAAKELIGTFGFMSSTEIDKFAGFKHQTTDSGIPLLGQDVLAVFEVSVDSMIDVGTHIVFIGTVQAAQVTDEGTPLTYAYYHQVMRGKTPAKAATYNDGDDMHLDDAKTPAAGAGEPKVGWRCKLCGFTVEGYPDGLPEDWRCPMCGAGRDLFERVTIES